MPSYFVFVKILAFIQPFCLSWHEDKKYWDVGPVRLYSVRKILLLLQVCMLYDNLWKNIQIQWHLKALTELTRSYQAACDIRVPVNCWWGLRCSGADKGWSSTMNCNFIIYSLVTVSAEWCFKQVWIETCIAVATAQWQTSKWPNPLLA